MFGATYMAYMEVFPVWARSPASLGGPAWPSRRLGVVQGTGALGTLVASLLVYPALCRAVGQEGVFVAGVLLNLAAYPWPAVLTAAGAQQAEPGATAALVLSGFLNAAGWEFCFTSANLMIKSSVPRRHAGAALGLGSSASATGICIGPVAGASLFALSR